MCFAGSRRGAVLIVENDRRLSDLAATMMNEFDLDIAQVSDAEHALDYLCAHPAGVQIALIGTSPGSGMNAVALAQRISVLWPTMSVIVVADDITPEDEARRPSRTTFVSRPWRPLDIVAAAANAAHADHSVRSIRF